MLGLPNGKTFPNRKAEINHDFNEYNNSKFLISRKKCSYERVLDFAWKLCYCQVIIWTHKKGYAYKVSTHSTNSVHIII